MSELSKDVIEFVQTQASSDGYRDYLRDTLVKLIALDTVPGADIARTAERESAMFAWLGEQVQAILGPQATIEQRPIESAIGDDPDYTIPGYAIGADGKVPSPGEIYKQRGNLLVTVPGQDGEAKVKVILHAHIDTVGPWSGPEVEGTRVFGRGSCDNKGQVALLLAQMKLLKQMEETLGRKAAGGRVYQFVIDEEVGGNGSLSAVRDERYAGLPVLMHECTDRVPYCAHRGAIDYRCVLSTGPNEGITAVELFPFVVQELEGEGRRLQQESRVPMFTPEQVQTNHGRLGHFGVDAGSVCDHVAIEILTRAKANPQRIAMKMVEFLDDAVVDYARIYGDKARETDPATGQPKVERHFELQVIPDPEVQKFRLDVYGKAGHMGAISECDNAITKASYLLSLLLRVAGSFPGIQAYARLADGADGQAGDDNTLTLEGSQGFSPAHKKDVLKERLTSAARRGVQQYCQIRGCRFDESMVAMHFDRLHNDAYADAPTVAPMKALKEAFQGLGMAWPTLAAWSTSCDARIYHHKGHPVAIFGAGRLEVAHSDREFVELAELQEALAVSTLASWSLIQ